MGAEQFEQAAEPYLQGAALVLTPAGIISDGLTLFTGQDIYGNPATMLDRGVSAVGLVTAGGSSTVPRVINLLTGGYSAAQHIWKVPTR